MGNVRLYGATSGYTELAPPAVAPDGVLSLPSGTGTLLKAEGGKILQIVMATDTTQRSTTSTSYVDVTGMSVTITPQKLDSAILIMAIFSVEISGSNTERRADFRIADASNNPIAGADEARVGSTGLSASGVAAENHCPTLLGKSTPATTSPVTYKLRMKSINSSNTTFVRNNAHFGQMYAIEVSA